MGDGGEVRHLSMSRPNLKLCVRVGGSHISMPRPNLKLCVRVGGQSSFHVQAKSKLCVRVKGVSHVCIGLFPSLNFEHFLSALRLCLGITEVFTRKTKNRLKA